MCSDLAYSLGSCYLNDTGTLYAVIVAALIVGSFVGTVVGLIALTQRKN